jgi:hypothetical protein
MPRRKIIGKKKRKETKTHTEKIKKFLYKYKLPLSTLLATVTGALILKKINSGKSLTPEEIEELKKIKNEVENSPENLQGNLTLPSPPVFHGKPPSPPPQPPPPPPPKKKHEIKIKKGTSQQPQGFKPPSEADLGGMLKGLKKVERNQGPKKFEIPPLIREIKQGVKLKPSGTRKKDIPSHGLSVEQIKNMKPEEDEFQDARDSFDFGKSFARKSAKRTGKKNKLKTLKKDLMLLLRASR